MFRLRWGDRAASIIGAARIETASRIESVTAPRSDSPGWRAYGGCTGFLFGILGLLPVHNAEGELVDTMWDLIVNAIGAGAIVLAGCSWPKTSEGDSFLDRWIERSVDVLD